MRLPQNVVSLLKKLWVNRLVCIWSRLNKGWKTAMSKKIVKVTQLRSTAGRLKAHIACVTGLGLRRIGHTVEVEDTPSTRGMMNKVNYLIKVEDI